ncbi:MAG TPA: SDR family oxidoreductase [Anaeromyxobacteraceae bacterium]|nr:SDR family oxidoreductase [Anaeromyxobacteraceae bacterium]
MEAGLDGRVVLVTGATNGIGLEIARGLARAGARVLLAGRDPARGEAAARSVAEGAAGTAEPLTADLSSRSQVLALAREVRSRTGRLDVLVNNAGAIFDSRRLSADGFEMTWALNHLSYFLLTCELLPLVAAAPGGRIVNVASSAHRSGRIDFDDLQGERRWTMWKAYAQSKLANVLFTRELARRLRGSPITANAVHPGAIASGFGREHRGLFGKLVAIGAPLLGTPERGARTPLLLATSPSFAGVTGGYFSGGRQRTPAPAARDDAAALRLWQISEAMTQPETRPPTP